jgi:hypothetical protein
MVNELVSRTEPAPDHGGEPPMGLLPGAETSDRVTTRSGPPRMAWIETTLDTIPPVRRLLDGRAGANHSEPTMRVSPLRSPLSRNAVRTATVMVSGS